jgi:hypothetical protein
VGTIRLFADKRGLSREALLNLHHSELAMNYIEETLGHLIVLSSRIGIAAADWNVQSTRAQLALSKVLTALERAEPWELSAEGAERPCDREWEKAVTRAKQGVRTVAALAAALCSRHIAPVDRFQTERAIALQIGKLMAELSRVRALLHECGRPYPVYPARGKALYVDGHGIHRTYATKRQ